MKNALSFLFDKKILRNIYLLSSGEIVSKAIAFLTVVYLARIISAEGFGILGFTSGFLSYFLLFVGFGLETYGMREAALGRDDSDKMSRLVSGIVTLRLVLAAASYVLLIIAVVFINKPLLTKYVLLVSGLNFFPAALLLNWYYQGMERMKLVAARNIGMNVLVLTGTYLFVRTGDDLLLAVAIPVLSSVINSLFLLKHYSRRYSRIKLMTDYGYLRELVRASYPLFFSSLMISVYYNLDIVMLGYFRTDAETGIYNAAVKIFLLSTVPYQIILTSFFPSLSKNKPDGSSEFRLIISRYGVIMVGAGVVLSGIIFSFPSEILHIIFGESYLSAVGPLKILALNSLVVSVNIFFGNPLIAWGRQRAYAVTVTAGAVANIVLNILLIPEYSYIGASFATLLSETVVFCGVFYVYNTVLYKAKSSRYSSKLPI